MASTNQAGQKRVAILMENHFEDSLFQVPYQALQQAGAKITIIVNQTIRLLKFGRLTLMDLSFLSAIFEPILLLLI